MLDQDEKVKDWKPDNKNCTNTHADDGTVRALTGAALRLDALRTNEARDSKGTQLQELSAV